MKRKHRRVRAWKVRKSPKNEWFAGVAFMKIGNKTYPIRGELKLQKKQIMMIIQSVGKGFKY
jgi:hypothetical protein